MTLPVSDIDHVVVMLAALDFVDRLAALEVVLGDEAGGFELGQHAIDRGQADLVVVLEQLAINVLGGHVLAVGSFKDFENAHARMRDLEPGFAQILSFHEFAC